jgi:hypothetical protein
VRRRAIYCALKYGLLPSRFYEKERHYACSYWAHLWMNLGVALRWLTGFETTDDIDFELEANA